MFCMPTQTKSREKLVSDNIWVSKLELIIIINCSQRGQTNSQYRQVIIIIYTQYISSRIDVSFIEIQIAAKGKSLSRGSD